jgi:hypothetical protein
MAIMILPVIKGLARGIRLDCFEIPGAVVFTTEGECGTPLGYRAVCEKIGGGSATVRLYGISLSGQNVLRHSFTVDSMGEAGLWATYWCEGSLGRI